MSLLVYRLCGFQPFWHNTKMETVIAILNGNYSFDTPEWQDLSPSSKDLVCRVRLLCYGFCCCQCLFWHFVFFYQNYTVDVIDQVTVCLYRPIVV